MCRRANKHQRMACKKAPVIASSMPILSAIADAPEKVPLYKTLASDGQDDTGVVGPRVPSTCCKVTKCVIVAPLAIGAVIFTKGIILVPALIGRSIYKCVQRKKNKLMPPALEVSQRLALQPLGDAAAQTKAGLEKAQALMMTCRGALRCLRGETYVLLAEFEQPMSGQLFSVIVTSGHLVVLRRVKRCITRCVRYELVGLVRLSDVQSVTEFVLAPTPATASFSNTGSILHIKAQDGSCLDLPLPKSAHGPTTKAAILLALNNTFQSTNNQQQSEHANTKYNHEVAAPPYSPTTTTATATSGVSQVNINNDHDGGADDDVLLNVA